MGYPFRVSAEGLIFIQVMVNDQFTGEFLLDTGAGLHVLSQKFFQRLASEPLGHFTGFRHTGERLDLELYQIASLNIGDVCQTHPIVATWEVLDQYGMAGILSAKFFEQHMATLDFTRHELIFEDEKSMEGILQHGNSVPLKLAEDRDKTLVPFVDVMIADMVVAECEVDTGSDGLLILDARYLNHLKQNGQFASVPQAEATSVTGKNEARQTSIISAIALRAAPAVMVEHAEVIFKDHLIFDGDLGIKFWQDKKLTLDIPHRRLIVA